MKIVSAFKQENGLYNVDLNVLYSSHIHGYFTKEQDESFKFRNLRDLTKEQAESIAGLANSLYYMGSTAAKKQIAVNLGLIDVLNCK